MALQEQGQPEGLLRASRLHHTEDREEHLEEDPQMKLFHGRVICAAGLLAMLVLPSGCDHLDEDEQASSGALLKVSSVTPSAVRSDVSPSTDPNTMVSTPPENDQVLFGVTNSSTIDALVLSFTIVCENGTLDTAAQPLAAPVAAGATVPIPLTMATGAFKEANMAALLAIGADVCRVKFSGETLNGDPISTSDSLVGFTFVDDP